MSARRPPPAPTRANQLAASDPKISAWVSAHAGSGKTHVLSQRVLRLLLDRTPPSRILCLTYTKAAAANMAARVFDHLARWALMDDDALDSAVREMTGEVLAPQDRDFARRLFARAVETPGGLKIQTIHAFCERTLHRFPFEANVPASFSVLDDIERAELLERAGKEVLARAAREDDSLHDAVTEVARYASGVSFAGLVSELLAFRGALNDHDNEEIYARNLRRRLGLADAETLASIEAQIIDGGIESARWPSLALRLRKGSANDHKLAERLERASALAPHSDCIEHYLLVYFTQNGVPRGGKRALLTKKLCDEEPTLLGELEAESDRLAPLIEKRTSAVAFQRSLALARLGRAVVAEYERRKNLHALFDFDDLIERMRALLRRSSPSWVLYKLDEQIDHVLLDEAQDTSAPQWEILQAIANEFAQGAEGRRRRSFFAVGDEKQSIFSFQGAAPKKFDEMRRAFKRRFDAAEMAFEQVPLHLSFRSAPVILSCVDTVFAHPDHRRGLACDPQEPAPKHEAFKSETLGLVEIWELVGPSKKEEPTDWRLPMDYVSDDEPAVRVARNVARKIAQLLAPASGEWVEGREGPRRVEPGDILILVRRRDAFFEAMIRALKEQRIAVAGADRLDLVNHIAVMDLCALGKAALLPQDDLTLAVVLKSPLIGLDDDDLVAIAPHRSGALIDALAASANDKHWEAARKIEAWRQQAHRLSPFAFFAHVLGPDRGRERLVARLGLEANDAIDEFLRLALAYERDEAGGLTGFLASVERLDVSIKRDMEAPGDCVRVMTVHAAKGLEAKIVFLPDTCGAPSGRHDPKIFAIGEDGLEEASLAWSPHTALDSAAVARAREDERQADREEYRRLLYVALTRAEERLYVAGYHGANGPGEGCWYEMIRSSLEPCFECLPDPLEEGAVILRSPNAPQPLALSAAAPAPAAVDIPAFAHTPAPFEPQPAPPLRPSSALAGADDAPASAAAPTKDDGARLLMGRLTHALLQYLPQAPVERRPEAARLFLQRRAQGLAAEQAEAIAQAAINVVESAALEKLFGPQSMAEVEIAATVATPRGPREIVGRMDRLAITDDEALIADFKTGAPRKAPSPQELRQLALYRAALAPLYPDRRIRCVLVWTQDASFVEPDDAALTKAFEEIE